MDCVTRGKYGYTDPSGKAREYSYSMGVKCDQASAEVRGVEKKEVIMFTISNTMFCTGPRIISPQPNQCERSTW